LKKKVSLGFLRHFVPTRRLVSFAIRIDVASKYGSVDLVGVADRYADKSNNVVVSRRLK
jgi:hypothetical protein